MKSQGNQPVSLNALSNEIINCSRCARLLDWAGTRKGKRKKFINEEYWSGPVPGFGDPEARLLIVGLAPGAHGANRTGRPFTGDAAGDHLYDALFSHGFSNKKISKDRFDGLRLKDVFITNVVRCSPPGDKPEKTELSSCMDYLKREMELLSNIEVILVLGKKAFDQIKIIIKDNNFDTKHLTFKHGACCTFENKFPVLKVSYHTSKRNYIRGIMNDRELDKIFCDIKGLFNLE